MTPASPAATVSVAPLKVVIFDVSDTVLRSGAPVDGIADTITTLRAAGIRVAMAANELAARVKTALNVAGIDVDLVIGRDTAGSPKPSPRFCRIAGERFDAQSHEMIYVGDNDDTDALCAVNAKVLYLAARWANPSPRYGLPVDDPDALLRFVFRFMLAPPRWYWTKEMNDKLGRPLRVRALLPAAKSSYDLKAVLKFDNGAHRVEGLNYRGFLFRRFLTALYLDGLLDDVDTWAWYPTHTGKPKHRSFTNYLDQVSRLFRDTHVPNLLVRHAISEKLATARSQGRSVLFASQVRTVHLNSAYRQRVEGRHVLIVDDFCTQGYSFECARNLLYVGGARLVTCVAFGRYHDEYHVYSPKAGVSFDPWSPVSLDEHDGDFNLQIVRGVIDGGALDETRRLLQLTPVGTAPRARLTGL